MRDEKRQRIERVRFRREQFARWEGQYERNMAAGQMSDSVGKPLS